MAMFDNPKKELEELEAKLLKEEEWFSTELAQAKALIGEEPVKKPKTAKPKSAAPRTEAASPSKKASGKKRKKEEKPKSNRGLVILAILETLGIVGIVAYWMLYLL